MCQPTHLHELVKVHARGVTHRARTRARTLSLALLPPRTPLSPLSPVRLQLRLQLLQAAACGPVEQVHQCSLTGAHRAPQVGSQWPSGAAGCGCGRGSNCSGVRWRGWGQRGAAVRVGGCAGGCCRW